MVISSLSIATAGKQLGTEFTHKGEEGEKKKKERKRKTQILLGVKGWF